MVINQKKQIDESLTFELIHITIYVFDFSFSFASNVRSIIYVLKSFKLFKIEVVLFKFLNNGMCLVRFTRDTEDVGLF